tara:strand:- start:129 stop:506 length:378 start_codon:yes stop_codon:yes gene_type:complete
MNITNVVAAVIKKENLYLIAQRNRNKHFGLQWEFPGGKVENSESFQDALIREVWEELNITVNVHEKIAEENFKDEKIDVIIHYFLCSIKEGIINLTEHEDSLWVEKKNFHQYDLVAGDKKILSSI